MFGVWWGLYLACHRVDGMGAISQWATLDGRPLLAQRIPVVQIFARITQALRERIASESKRTHG